MKRTDLERRERELRRVEKRDEVAQRRAESGDKGVSVGILIDELFALFRYDDQEIFNTTDDMEVLAQLERIKDEQPEKQWDNILRKAIKKTKVSKKEKAFNELKELM